MKYSHFLLSSRSRYHLRRTLRHQRITFFCGLLTFVVLRSYVGAGKFGTPIQDYDEIRHHLHNFRLRHQQKLLLTEELRISDPSVQVDPSFLLKRDILVPSLSSSWMETGSSSGRPGDQTPPSAPRTLLVTSSQLNRCESAVEAHFLLKLLKNKMDYCSLHGIEVFLDAESESDSESARLRVLRRLLVSHPETEWIWWLDSTAMFTNMSHELPYESYAGHNVVMHYEASNGISRSVLIRNSEWALNHLQKVDWNSKPSEEVMVDMEMKVDDFGGSTEEGDGTWPFITDFGSCNMCTKGMDLGCMSRIERAFIYADGQHRHVISG